MSKTRFAVLCAVGACLAAGAPAAADVPVAVVSREGGVLTVAGSDTAETINVDGVLSGPFAFLVVTIAGGQPAVAGPGCSPLPTPGAFGCGVHSGATALDIRGGAGDDTISWLVPASGSVSGGSGNDRILPAADVAGMAGPSGVRVNGRDGVDTVDYSRVSRGVLVSLGANADDGRPGDHDDVQGDVENVTATAYADRVEGSDQDNAIAPGTGIDVVFARGGYDYVYAEDGAPDDIDCGGGPLAEKTFVDPLDELFNCPGA